MAGKLWRLIADGHPVIEVDLADTTFMSARGIAVLVAARQLAALRGQVIRVVQPSPPARRVFDLGGVTRLLEPA
ncbi:MULTISPECIES: STAS domain-containing protein [unclassified Nocardioides]|uniref:STAS domain-containing protein n=1 Tax=unclassified Nocardioides TaxID=2615069 RepID=UPI000A017957|nr:MULTISPECIES: STAS domain-containing protein [unclassified Nocardioides]